MRRPTREHSTSPAIAYSLGSLHAVYKSLSHFPDRRSAQSLRPTVASLQRQLTVERIFAAPDLSGPRLREPEILARRALRDLSAGQGGQQGSARSLGVRHALRHSEIAGGLARVGRRHRTVCRPRRKRAANDSAPRRCAASLSTSSRATASSCWCRWLAICISTICVREDRPGAPADHHRCIRDRCAIFAARPLCQLHSRSGSVRDRYRTAARNAR